MTTPESSGFWRRILAALGRGLLGKASDGYMKQFTGSDEYWDRAIAAQLGWPKKQPANPGPQFVNGSGQALVPAAPGIVAIPRSGQFQKQPNPTAGGPS